MTHSMRAQDDIQLRFVVYTSSYTGSDIDTDLSNIKKQAHRNNPQRGVTGVLLFDSGRFIQAVEGPAAAIDDLLMQIQRDKRNHDLEVLIDVAVTHRSFQQWVMWVGKLNDGGRGADEIRAFRNAYLKTFKPDGDGFVELVKRLLMGGASST